MVISDVTPREFETSQNTGTPLGPFAIRCEFTREEQDFIYEVTNSRQNPKLFKDGFDPRKSKQWPGSDPMVTHRKGAMGEYAFAQYFDLPFGPSTTLSGDKQKDFSMFGVGIEVKTRRPLLTMNPEELERCKAFLLVHVTFVPDDWSKCWLQGFIPLDVFKTIYEDSSIRNIPVKWVHPVHLQDIRELWDYCFNVKAGQRKFEEDMKRLTNVEMMGLDTPDPGEYVW